MDSNIEKTLEELKYCYHFVQMVRGLIFWEVELGESRDRLALIILAKHTKNWFEGSPGRVNDEAKTFLLKHCQKILDAGPKSDGPEMPAPWGVGLSIH